MNFMELMDGRKLSREALHERHRQIVRKYRRGCSKAAISRELGVSYSAVYTTIWRYEREGSGSLVPQRKGRRKGSDRYYLNEEQSSLIRRMICERRPEQLGMAFALWARPAVRALIEHECGVVLPIRVVGNYLQRWGMSPPKPIKRAYEQSAPAVKRWLERTYPALAERARAEGAEIYWGEETAVVNAAGCGCGYAPKGKTPVAMAVGGTREKLSMISTVSNQCSRARWMIIEGAFTGDRLIEFFAALIKDAPRRVFIILDNSSVHHCPPVKAWLGEHAERIEAFYRPGAELESDERLNAGLRHAPGARVAVHNPSHTQGREQHNRRGNPAQRPERIRTHFGDLRVK